MKNYLTVLAGLNFLNEKHWEGIKAYTTNTLIETLVDAEGNVLIYD